MTFRNKNPSAFVDGAQTQRDVVLLQGRGLFPPAGVEDAAPTNIGFQYKKGFALTDSALSIAFQSKKLLLDLGNNAGTNGVAALADSETQALFHGDGVISSTCISTLSPGMHISVPSGGVMMPVTSVVRK